MQPITIDDYGLTKEPGQPKFSPDGRHIAFMLKGSAYVMKASDKTSCIELTEAKSGYKDIQLVWSSNGKLLYLLYYKNKDKTYYICTIKIDNSEIWKDFTQTDTEVWNISLSPNRDLLLLSANELPARSPSEEEKCEYAPIVIDAMVFKKDAKGYLEKDATHSIYSWHCKNNAATKLTDDHGHDTYATWSPNGDRIAFIREDLSKAEYHGDLCVVAADGAGDLKPDVLTTSKADRRSPAWSPDGKSIACIRRDAEMGPYAVGHLAIISVETRREVILTKTLDRTLTSFQFSHDGAFIYFVYDNEGGSHLARIRLRDNHIETLLAGDRFIASFDVNAAGHIALKMKTMNDAAEIYLMTDGEPEAMTSFNQSFFAIRRLGDKEHWFYRTKAGRDIQAIVTKPADFDEKKRYPTVLRIHGGPVQQATFGYDFLSQYLAADGYVVVEPNPPGSTGRGQEFIAGCKKDWGYNAEPDALGAIDEAVSRGYADPDRLGIIGYSYGGYMTNCIITVAPKKFKAAVSGAGHSFIAANYGHDIYLKWYNWGLGHPWDPEKRKQYEALSPLNHVDKVETPTLFLSGAQDWNVPILNSELFYQALRVRGVPTQLVVYPKAAHHAHWEVGGCNNSKDYYQRIRDWLNRFMRP